MSSIKKTCICSFCIALCYALPLAFHALALGRAFSPLHLPVLLCGLVCGWPYGLFCGIAGPLLSSLLSGMPATVQLIHMIPELCAYGLFTGLFLQLIHTKRLYADLYLALIPALFLGRVVGGVASALFYLSNAQSYSLALWASAYLVGTTPAVILQLIVLPTLVVILTRTHLIPNRYPQPAAAQ